MQMQKRPISPCKKGNEDCKDRMLGCRRGCKEWIEYEAAMKIYREEQLKCSELRNSSKKGMSKAYGEC